MWPTDDPTGTQASEGPDSDPYPWEFEPAGSPESYRQRAEDREQEETERAL